MSERTMQVFLHSVLLCCFHFHAKFFKKSCFHSILFSHLLLKILSPTLFTDPPTKTAKISFLHRFRNFQTKNRATQ